MRRFHELELASAQSEETRLKHDVAVKSRLSKSAALSLALIGDEADTDGVGGNADGSNKRVEAEDRVRKLLQDVQEARQQLTAVQKKALAQQQRLAELGVDYSTCQAAFTAAKTSAL